MLASVLRRKDESATLSAPCRNEEDDPKEESKRALTALDEALNKLEKSQKVAKKVLLNFSTIPSKIKAFIDLPRQEKLELAKAQWQNVKDSAHHTWVGLKLFVAEVRIASGLALKVRVLPCVRTCSPALPPPLPPKLSLSISDDCWHHRI